MEIWRMCPQKVKREPFFVSHVRENARWRLEFISVFTWVRLDNYLKWCHGWVWCFKKYLPMLVEKISDHGCCKKYPSSLQNVVHYRHEYQTKMPDEMVTKIENEYEKISDGVAIICCSSPYYRDILKMVSIIIL